MKTNLHTIHTEYFDSFYPNKTKIKGEQMPEVYFI